MQYSDLHTYTLEQLFGAIQCRIVKADANTRIVHLLDTSQISRTLALVRFYPFKHTLLERAHQSILSGSLLGKTLFESGIKFRKEVVASFDVTLPEWLKQDFITGLG